MRRHHVMRLAFRARFATAAFAVLALSMSSAPVAAQASGDVARLPSVTLPPELERVLRDYERAWTAGDARALAALFTDDGFPSSSRGWVRGTAQIDAEYQRAGGQLLLRALAYAADDSTGYIVGAYGYGPDAADVDAGRFILALRRAPDGRWLIAADLDNTNRPPQR